MSLSAASDDALRQGQYSTADKLKARIRLHQQFSTAAESWDSFILSNLHLSPGESVLELGCGNASQTRNNRQSYPALLTYHLADFSLGMLQEAISELKSDPRFSFSAQDAQALAFPQASFDCVTANHMLYHVPDIRLALQEIKRLLKPGGRLMATTNGQGHMQDLDLLVQSFFPSAPRLHNFHSRFTLEDGFALLNSVFGNCTIETYSSDLWITKAEPLTDYVLSLEGIATNPDLQTPRILTKRFQELIDANGGIRIRKSSGALLTTK